MSQESNIWNILTPEAIFKNDVGKNRDYFIPERFRKQIFLHTIPNIQSEKILNHGIRAPLMLGIHGPAGSGKSWQVRVACAELGLHVIRLSGSALSSRWEGVPQEMMHEAYVITAKENKGRAVLVIDDFDTSSAAQDDNVTYTVNSQLLTGALMNIADDPHNVSGQSLPRVPIILTGNNFTNVYYPLLRLGRMSLFAWETDMAERKRIVKTIFAESDLKDDQAEALARMTVSHDGITQTAPISFYDEVKRQLWEDTIWDNWNASANGTGNGTFIGTDTQSTKAIEDALETTNQSWSFAQLMEMSMKIQQHHHAVDFIHSESVPE